VEVSDVAILQLELAVLRLYLHQSLLQLRAPQRKSIISNLQLCFSVVQFSLQANDLLMHRLLRLTLGNGLRGGSLQLLPLVLHLPAELNCSSLHYLCLAASDIKLRQNANCLHLLFIFVAWGACIGNSRERRAATR